MDPLSISASIIALLQITSTVITYLSDVKDGPKELQRIRVEISGVLTILYVLQDQADQAKEGDPFSSTLKSLNVANGPFKQFYTAMECLASILAPVKGWRKGLQALKWPSEKEEIRKILDTIERQKTLFALARQHDHIALSKAIRADVEIMHKRVNEIGLSITNLQVGEGHRNIRQWLFAPDPSSNYNKALKDRYETTGDWFLKTDAYLDWLSSPSSFLWLYGMPGCGKTILSSAIIQRTIAYGRSQTDSVVLYFYFDFNDVEKQNNEKMIRSLIVQLCSQFAKTPQALDLLYSSCMNGERQPEYDALLATLHQMMGHFAETFLIIDALDECLERQELLASIEELASWKDANLRILTTSRRENDIEESMKLLYGDQGKMSIQSVLVRDDIRTFVRGRLRTDPTLKRWQKQPEVQKEIEDTLMDKADGMFRWATCQLDSLKNCMNLSGLRKALASLPRTLNDTYTRILCNIDEDHYRYALRILQWLTYSARPLELAELAEVVAIDVEESPRFNPRNRFPDPRDIFTICSGLISLGEDTLDEWNNRHDGNSVVRLAHFSVKEYLVSNAILQGKANRYSIQEINANVSISNDCIAYLLSFDGLQYLTSQSLTEFPLARYAASYWVQHARVAERDNNFNPSLAIELFLARGNALLNWVRLWNPDQPRNGLDLERSLSTICPPLYYASRVGLYKSVRILLDKGADVNALGGAGTTALLEASYAGHDQVVQILLERGADVNASGGRYSNVLQAASYKGHDQMVQMLLEKRADVSVSSGYHDNALQAASHEGHDRVVQMLLGKGADVNASDGRVGNALQAALHEGHDRVVQMLLGNGADVNASDGRFGNALQAASYKGHGQVVQILLENGADVNISGGWFGNALEAASYKGHGQVVKTLLEKGADVNALGYGNALQAAWSKGHTHVVKMLLQKVADVNTLSENDSDTLQSAI